MRNKLACICKFHIVPSPRLTNGKMNSPWLKAQVYPIQDNPADLLLLTDLHLTFVVIFRTCGVVYGRNVCLVHFLCSQPHTSVGHPKGRGTLATRVSLLPP